MVLHLFILLVTYCICLHRQICMSCKICVCVCVHVSSCVFAHILHCIYACVWSACECMRLYECMCVLISVCECSRPHFDSANSVLCCQMTIWETTAALQAEGVFNLCVKHSNISTATSICLQIALCAILIVLTISLQKLSPLWQSFIFL